MDCAFSSAKKDPEFSVGAGRSGRVMRTIRSKGAARWRHRPSWRSRAGGHHKVAAACAVPVLTTTSRQRVPVPRSPPGRGSACPCPSPRRGSACRAGAYLHVEAACARADAHHQVEAACARADAHHQVEAACVRADAHHQVEAARAVPVLTTSSRQRVQYRCSPRGRGSVCPCRCSPPGRGSAWPRWFLPPGQGGACRARCHKGCNFCTLCGHRLARQVEAACADAVPGRGRRASQRLEFTDIA